MINAQYISIMSRNRGGCYHWQIGDGAISVLKHFFTNISLFFREAGMQTKTSYEEEILREVESLPKEAQKKIAKFIYLLQSEFIETNLEEKNATDEFLAVCGDWEDDKSVENQIKDIF